MDKEDQLISEGRQIMAKFLTELDVQLKESDEKIWVLISPLIYQSDLMKCDIKVPAGFESDLASVPRVPVAYMFWGGRCHREAFLHDYAYRKDSVPIFSFREANAVFLEAMKVRNKRVYVRYPMWWGVVAGGWFSYHKKLVNYRYE